MEEVTWKTFPGTNGSDSVVLEGKRQCTAESKHHQVYVHCRLSFGCCLADVGRQQREHCLFGLNPCDGKTATWTDNTLVNPCTVQR